MRNIKVFLLTIILIVVFGGCITKETELDKGNGVDLERKDNVVAVYSKDDLAGVKIYVNKEIKADDIKISSKKMKIVTYSKEGTEISIVSKTGILENLILEIKSRERLEIDVLSKVTPLMIESYTQKRSDTENKLLGDFNSDNKVNILDFGVFIKNYNTTDSKYDIAPAKKGIGEWSNIFCKETKDGQVNLFDLVAFGNNYGKIKPVIEKKVTAITLTGSEKTVVGGTITLTAEATYTDGTKDSEGINWSTSNASVASVGQGIVAGLRTGIVTITASKDGKTISKEIIVEDKTKGITIYLENPFNGGLPYIWYDADLDTPAWDTEILKGTNSVMEEYIAGWYKKEIGESSGVEILFNNGTWDSKFDSTGVTSASQTTNFNITNTVWITKDGAIHNTDPVGPQAPSVIVDPEGKYFKTTVKVVLNILFDSNTNIGDMKYTINGSDPKTSGITFINGQEIELGGGMSDGDKVILKIYSSATRKDTGAILENEISYTYIKGERVLADLDILGATYLSESTTFKYWSPYSENVSVWINGQEYQMNKIADENGYTNVYGAIVQGDLKNKTYKFKVDGVVVRDPYGKMVEGETLNFIVMDTASIEPDGGWASLPELKEREDAIIYEIHVRDLTVDSTSGISDNKKGKYLGLVEKGTNYNGSVTGIDYLKELGVTHVQILPMADFPDGWGTYNWGYGSINYNIPEDKYSMKARDDYEGRVKEWQTMVNEFHKNGIRVIMDVVYNHTANVGTLPDYYYHSSEDLIDDKDLSGCGNSIDVGKDPMVSRWVQDSLEYLVRTYRFDGFRFDLIGVHEYEEVGKWSRNLNNKFPDRTILFYGEPWNGYAEDPKSDQKLRLDKLPLIEDAHVGGFNDQFRNAVKGEGDHSEMGYMFNWREPAIGKTIGDVAVGMRGSIDRFASDPEQSINYLTAHDNFALWDKIKFSAQYDIEYLYAKRISMFGYGVILTSQGIPFIHGGEEMLRTKVADGNMSWDRKISESEFDIIKNTNDGTKGGDNVNKFRWNWTIDNSDVVDYYKGLIKMRREHSGFRMNTKSEIQANVITDVLNNSVVIVSINAEANGDSWKKIIVIANSGDSYTYSLDGSWKIAVQGTNSNVGGIPVSGSVESEGTSITVLYQD